jgi:hypothetical protein
MGSVHQFAEATHPLPGRKAVRRSNYFWPGIRVWRQPKMNHADDHAAPGRSASESSHGDVRPAAPLAGVRWVGSGRKAAVARPSDVIRHGHRGYYLQLTRFIAAAAVLVLRWFGWCNPTSGHVLPQQKILSDQIPLAADEWCLAATTRYFAINCFRSGFDLDDLIERVAVRAME